MRRLLLLGALVLATTGFGQSLVPGSKAPVFEPESWIQAPVPIKLDSGKITVLEFWATWCGPCIDQMPHLSELSEKYKGSISFVGVNVYDYKDGEKTPKNRVHTNRIAQFLKEQDKNLRYPVALDSFKAPITKAWMDAAERNTIPTTFVIDKNGIIAWIGHPEDLDDVLTKLGAGKWDYIKAATDYKKVVTDRKAAKERDEKTAAAISAAAKSNDVDAFERATKALGYGAKTNIRLGLEMAVSHSPDFVATFVNEAMWADTRFDSISVCKLGMLVVQSKKGAKTTARGLEICRKAVAHPDTEAELVCYSHCFYAQALYSARQVKQARGEISNAKAIALKLPSDTRKSALEYIETMVKGWN